MCWYSKSEPIKKIADTDVTVYKIFREVNDVIYSPVYLYEQWIIGIEKSLGKQIPVYSCGQNDYITYEIHEGFHSFNTIPYTVKIYDDIDDISGKKIWQIDTYRSTQLTYRPDDIICECIIPRGSSYYINDYNWIVSDKLKIIKKIE